MLTRLREIVEKVASAPRLNEALDILVTDICLAMETEVCSVYLADHDRRCYYLMATRGLKKPRGRTVTLAFDQGIVGLVGRLAEPINLADAQKHPSFKYIPAVKEVVSYEREKPVQKGHGRQALPEHLPRVRDEIEKTRGFVGTAGVFHMSPQDHMGLSVDAFKMVEVRKGNWVIID